MPITTVQNTMIGTSSNVTVLAPAVPLYENTRTVTTSYTITAGSSAMSVGPLTINSSVAIVIPSGSKWVVL
jgi:hypothetical protein